jgi:hypothetical protein
VVSASARGQCPTPHGTTNSSGGLGTTSRSRSWMVRFPSRNQEELIGVGVLVPVKSALDLHDPDVVVVDQHSAKRASTASMFSAEPRF